ncbi:adhesin biosynthesis transcription regulatory protein [Enterobacter sp. WP_7_1]|nr:adhesin biosynthesis transcription regulatory protein [Enterobacter sp. WP_7_1]
MKVRSCALIAGGVAEEQFELLVELSSIHSEKIVQALREHLVLGKPRKEACEKYGANISYFSVALGRLFRTNLLVSQLASYYCRQPVY